MTFPKVDLEELDAQKKKNFQERLKFIEMYAKWLKEGNDKKDTK